jgi:hypothetical protein
MIEWINPTTHYGLDWLVFCGLPEPFVSELNATDAHVPRRVLQVLAREGIVPPPDHRGIKGIDLLIALAKGIRAKTRSQKAADLRQAIRARLGIPQGGQGPHGRESSKTR